MAAGSLIKYPGGNTIIFFPWAASQGIPKTFPTVRLPGIKGNWFSAAAGPALLHRGRDDLKSRLKRILDNKKQVPCGLCLTSACTFAFPRE